MTGGTKGIGYAVARALVSHQMNVVISARSKDEVAEAAERLGAGSQGKVIGAVADVRDLDQMRAVAEQAVSTFGSLDLLVANAGVGRYVPIDEMEPETWNTILDTNLTGVFNSVKAAIPALKDSHGMIVTIGSLAGVNAFNGGAAYNASKFGLVGFTHAIMLDLRPHGVRVSTIMPGSVATHFGGRSAPTEDGWKIQADDIADTVVYLLGVPARTLPSRIEVRPSRPPER